MGREVGGGSGQGKRVHLWRMHVDVWRTIIIVLQQVRILSTQMITFPKEVRRFFSTCPSNLVSRINRFHSYQQITFPTHLPWELQPERVERLKKRTKTKIYKYISYDFFLVIKLIHNSYKKFRKYKKEKITHEHITQTCNLLAFPNSPFSFLSFFLPSPTVVT